MHHQVLILLCVNGCQYAQSGKTPGLQLLLLLGQSVMKLRDGHYFQTSILHKCHPIKKN